MNRNAAMTAIKASWQKTNKKRNGNMILKTGYQCVNDMARGGPRMGEFIVNIAMRFSFKSGLLVNIFRQLLPKYNRPFLVVGVSPRVFVPLRLTYRHYSLCCMPVSRENNTREPLTYDR